jgi:hypothetical protein
MLARVPGAPALENEGVSLRDLVTDFESLGNNCELGIVQRSLGAEPLGLFRWAGINHVEMLINALHSQFEGLGDPRFVDHEVLRGWDHHAAIDKKFGFYFHTDLDPTQVADRPEDRGRLAAHEGRRLKFLVGNLLNVLRTGEKILVYRQKAPLEPGQLDRLSKAIARIGPSTLLLIIEDPSREPGAIEVKHEALIIGYARVLSNENPPNIDFDAWHRIIPAAHAVWKRGRSVNDRTSISQVPLRGIFDRSLTAAPDSLLAGFESLGHGAEFAVAQRFAGIEPAGLLRFASLSHTGLFDLLTNHFSHLTDPSELSLTLRNGEYHVRIDRYGFEYQTGVWDGQALPGDLLQRERMKISFSKQQILDDLAAGQKILVRFDDAVSRSEIRQVFGLLKRYGPNKLLWVDTAPRPDLVGSIDMIEPGLLRGYVAGRSAFAAPTPQALSIWLKIALDARDIFAREQNDGSVWARGTWKITDDVTTTVADKVEGTPFGQRVFEHCFIVDRPDHAVDVLIHDIRYDMKPNALYTISAWICIPSSFTGTGVAMLAIGFPSVHGWQANLSIRDQWQQIVTSFRQPAGTVAAAPGMRATGRVGDRLYSTGWRLDEGVVPSTCFL